MARQILELFPALELIEQFKPRSEESRHTTADFRHPAAEGQTADRGHTLGDYRILREIGRGGMGIVSEATALQRGGLIGQRLDSLSRLSQAGRLLMSDGDWEARQASLRDHAIAAMGLSDLDVERTVEVGPVMSLACDRKLKRYAVLEYGTGETVVRSLDDGRL